jgi:hypothetical protein
MALGATSREDWAPKAKAVQLADDQFRIKRFRLISGEEITLYCKLVKVRAVLAATFRLYEDAQGRQWLEISMNAASHLLPLSGVSFEQQVAAELLTLGVNKYSG